MRLHFILITFFSLLIVNSVLGQKTQQIPFNEAVLPVTPDTFDLDLPTLMPELVDSTLADDLWYYGMPIVKPCCLDAKMKYWWPSEEYNYNMPNAYQRKGNLYRFKYE